MGISQATVNGTALDNSSWRRIHGTFQGTEGLDGKYHATVDFAVEGSSTDELQERINTTYNAFRLSNPTIVLTMDADASNNYRSITPGDGRHLATVTTVTVDPDYPPTDHSIGLTLVVIADLAVPSSLNITGLESLHVVEVINSARSRVRQVVGSFFSTSGSTAAANYAAARSTLLQTYCLCASTGAVHPTNKFVLVEEKKEDPGGLGLRLEFSLDSEYQKWPMAATEAARSATIKISASYPDEWDPRGGERPRIIQASGGVFVSLDVWTEGVLKAWSTVEPDIIAAIEEETGETAPQPMKVEISSDGDNGMLEFSATYIARNNVVMAFELTETVTDVFDEAEVEDSEGYDYVQRSPKPIKRSRNVQVTRVGVGKVNLGTMIPAPRPTLPGNNMAEIVGRVETCNGPKITEFGEVYKQSASYQIKERKVRSALAQLEFPVPVFGG